MKASKRIKRLVPREPVDRIVKRDDDGELYSVTTWHVAGSLKGWAREQVKYRTRHADICLAWLRNKGCTP